MATVSSEDHENRSIINLENEQQFSDEYSVNEPNQPLRQFPQGLLNRISYKWIVYPLIASGALSMGLCGGCLYGGRDSEQPKTEKERSLKEWLGLESKVEEEREKSPITLIQKITNQKPTFKNKIEGYDIEVYDRPEDELDIMKVTSKKPANAFGNYEIMTWNYFFNPKKNQVVKAQKTRAYGFSIEETEFDENNTLADTVLKEATHQYHQYLNQLQQETISEMRGKSPIRNTNP